MLSRPSSESHAIPWFRAFIPYKASEAIFSLLFPLFLVNVLDLHVGTVGLLTAFISLTAVPGSMLWGYLSDQHKQRRAYVVLGCVGSGGCLIAMALVQTVTPMLLLCLIYGLFSIAPAPVSSVLIMETNPQEQWEECFGTFHTIGGWSWVVGLTLGTVLLPVLQTWWPPGVSMRLVLFGLGLLTLAAAWWAHRTIPVPRRHASRHHYLTVTGRLPHPSLVEQVLYLPRRLLFVLHPSHLPNLRHMLKGNFACYLWITVAIFLSSNLAFTPFPLFVQDVLHMSTTHLFIFAWVRMLVATLCYEPAGRWAHHIGPQRALMWSLGLRGAAFLMFWSLWVWQTFWVLFPVIVILNVLIGISWSLLVVSSPTLVGKLAHSGQNGEAMGVYNATQGVARIVGAGLSGYLAQWVGYYGVFALAGGLLLPALSLLAQLRLPGDVQPHPHTTRPQPPHL